MIVFVNTTRLFFYKLKHLFLLLKSTANFFHFDFEVDLR